MFFINFTKFIIIRYDYEEEYKEMNVFVCNFTYCDVCCVSVINSLFWNSEISFAEFGYLFTW